MTAIPNISPFRRRIEQDVPRGVVSEEAARRFVRRSAWWHSHSSGKPVRAPRYAGRLMPPPAGWPDGDWYLQLGWNRFYVGRAVRECAATIGSGLDRLTARGSVDSAELVGNLRRSVLRCVRTGEAFSCEDYPLTDGHLMFGTISIKLDDFVAEALEWLPFIPRMECLIANGVAAIESSRGITDGE